MTREQKAEIARRNGARSRGPRSAAGKAASSRNALKHGRYASLALEPAARRAVASHEDKEQFLSLVRRNLHQLQPASPFERDLAIALADTQWRYERWNAAETQVLDYERRNIEALFEERCADGEDDDSTSADRDARAARALACRGDFLRRLTAERTRLLRERAQHLRLLRTIRVEFPLPPEQTPKRTPERTREQTDEQTNLIPFPVSVNY